MYISSIPNRKSPPAILLRESFRKNGKVKNRTLAERAVSAQAPGKGLINFCVGERLCFAIVPSETAKGGKIARETLLQIDAESILARDVPRMIGYVRSWN